jgi:hypothetical protein
LRIRVPARALQARREDGRGDGGELYENADEDDARGGEVQV